jgi:predicted small secreted protein
MDVLCGGINMKRLFLSGAALLAILFLLAGCDGLRTVRGTGDITSEEREVGDFSAVDLAGIGTVVVDFGDKTALRIEAEKNLLPYLESEVEGDTLVLGIREGVNILPTQGIFYYLTVHDLEDITVSGLGNVDVPRLEGTAAEINVTGGGDINIEELYAKDLDVVISGLGNLNIDGGEVADQEIEITGGGNYNASEMASEVARVTITGLGSAAVWARDVLDATISGGGSVRYTGRPQITENINGLGEVIPISGE